MNNKSSKPNSNTRRPNPKNHYKHCSLVQTSNLKRERNHEIEKQTNQAYQNRKTQNKSVRERRKGTQCKCTISDPEGPSGREAGESRTFSLQTRAQEEDKGEWEVTTLEMAAAGGPSEEVHRRWWRRRKKVAKMWEETATLGESPSF